MLRGDQITDGLLAALDCGGQLVLVVGVERVDADERRRRVVLVVDRTDARRSGVPDLAATLEGAQGTIPGADAEQSFKDRLSGWAEQANGKPLKDFSYGAESYDATILAALAAVKGGATDSETVQKNYAAVSGATGGEECTTFADCAAMIADGKEIKYAGPSGIGPIDDENDPSSAFVGIYTFNAQNKNELTSTVEGKK